MQLSTASRSGPGLSMSPSLGNRLRHMEVPLMPANCPGQTRSWHVETPPSVSRFCPSAALVLERPSQDRSFAVRLPVDSGHLQLRRTPNKVVHCYAWAPPVRETVPVAIPAERALEESYLKPLPPQESPTDDPHLGNPLARMERVNTAWMGVVFEYEGVVVEDNAALHSEAWQQVAEEECKPLPLHHAMQRAQGMKNEQVVSEVFCWSRAPMEVRRLSAKKEEIYQVLLGDRPPIVAEGVRSFLETLSRNEVPAALATSAPEARVGRTLKQVGLDKMFAAVITADDVHRGRPDPEAYLYAAQQIGRPPARVVVVGNSNQSIEAAREGGMQAIVVAGRQPLYELTAADLVVKQLDQLTFMNLKQLFGDESPITTHGEPEPEMELEVEEEEMRSPPLTYSSW